MNSMRRRLMVLLAIILLFFQLISVVWLWHESREQIGFLVNETLSAKSRNQHVEKEIHEAIASLLVPSLVMIGFTLLFSFWAITWITRPLNQLRTSLANRSADNLTPLPVYSDMLEISAVTRTLNQLLARLDHTLQQERLFTADAAHELRTPLAGIRLHLELMAKSGTPQAEPLITRIDQLMHTVEQLLMLARAGQAMASGHYQTLSWSDTIFAPLELEHDAKEHRLIWPPQSPLVAEGDAILLRLMLRNLLENAVRYSPKGTVIEVKLEETGDGTRVSVLDQGPGIDEAHRQSIAEPFRRIDQRYGGSGLGLSIVQRILQLHRGTLHLENRPEGGLRVSCWLPAKLR